MKKRMVAVLFGLLLAAGSASAQVVVRIGPPPHVRREIVPVRPGVGYVWQPGFYRYERRNYVWVPGRYVVAPRGYARWVPGHWAHRRGGYVWIEGHWRR
jgi:WXXGXW repeat (2 copies)